MDRPPARRLCAPSGELRDRAGKVRQGRRWLVSRRSNGILGSEELDGPVTVPIQLDLAMSEAPLEVPEGDFVVLPVDL